MSGCCLRNTFSTARLICRLVSVTAELFVAFVTLDNIYCRIFHALLRGQELNRFLLQRKGCSVSLWQGCHVNVWIWNSRPEVYKEMRLCIVREIGIQDVTVILNNYLYIRKSWVECYYKWYSLVFAILCGAEVNNSSDYRVTAPKGQLMVH